MPQSFRLNAVLFIVALISIAPPARALDAGDDNDDNDYQVPEGYEERRYSIATLIDRPQNFKLGEASFDVGAVLTLSEQNVIDIVRNCVAPDSWTKRGPARIEAGGIYLTVLQKKEVHAEIEKVLQWLQDGVAPPFRATVVAVSLKTETIQKLSAAKNIPAADLLKTLDEAGEGGAEIVELRGVEGQQVAALAGQRQSFVKDFDVSGAVYDPVIGSLATGMAASAVAYRNPDCASVQIDLSVRKLYKAEWDKAKLSLDGAVAGKAGQTVKEVKKDDKGKPIDTPEQKIPGKQESVDFKAELNMELPTQVAGGLQTSLTAAQGAFTLAGTIDFSLSTESAGKLTAIFVRATVGSPTVPTLTGVSGLKDGESYRLYPLVAGSRTVPNFSSVVLEQDYGQQFADLDKSPATAGAFAGAPAAPTNVERRFADTISKAKKQFAEKVRKNKIVEDMGPVLFTRLLEADHAKALKNLSDDNERQSTPFSIHALALALPQAAYRKLVLADSALFEAADIQALAGNGAAVLVDTGLKLLPWQNSNVFAGRHRSLVTDYEISGDSYDPVVRALAENSYAVNFKFWRASAGGVNQLEVRFASVPGKIAVERSVLDTFSINSGAETNVLFGLHADLDKHKSAAVTIRSTAQAPPAKYILAGSAQMPPGPDGKADARQVVLFVQVGE